MNVSIEALTEKPWEIRDYGTSPVSIMVKGLESVGSLAKVYVTGYRSRKRSAAFMAVAQLISTAPEMLDALRQAECAVEELCQGQDPANQCWTILALVRETIAKATKEIEL